MTRLVVALVAMFSLAACTSGRETRAPSDRSVTTTPGTVPATTKDTMQGVGRPAG